ncbi:MAG: hypothetical protein WAU16_06480, partial [Rhizobiaceae bacterium]
PRHAQGNIPVGDLHPVAGVNLPDSNRKMISKSSPLSHNAFLAVSINSLLRVWRVKCVLGLTLPVHILHAFRRL